MTWSKDPKFGINIDDENFNNFLKKISDDNHEKMKTVWDYVEIDQKFSFDEDKNDDYF